MFVHGDGSLEGMYSEKSCVVELNEQSHTPMTLDKIGKMLKNHYIQTVTNMKR